MPDSPYAGIVRIAPDPPAPKPEVKTTLSCTKCCALMEMDNLSASETPKEAFDAIFPTLYSWHASLVIFTGIVVIGERRKITSGMHPTPREDNYGQTFADWIVENGLGTITASEETLNAKSGNHVRVWIWKVNTEKLAELWREHMERLSKIQFDRMSS